MWYVRKDASGKPLAVVAGVSWELAVGGCDAPVVFDCQRVAMSADIDLVLWELVRAHNNVMGELR